MDPERVELKISLGAEGARKAKELLGFEDRDASRATIWFCDLPRDEGDAVHFELFDRGVIVRLRRRHGDDSDTTIKYRRSAPLILPAAGVARAGDPPVATGGVVVSVVVSVVIGFLFV